jgi:hypothetical protein
MNNNIKYKAYISYSHRDDKWASWLHNVLESYRVPRKLVGTVTDVGKVPARVSPVFRDRDDLSAADDLGGIVQQALEDSENLIVVCSPQSAASQWVNEEIHHFARLGRKDQIYCIIVDGDPAGAGTASACFPEALAEIGMLEPLAADVRQWADGKNLSKLKIISGMLGLPLDQLRRRDLQKRQKIWAFASVAALAIAVVMVTAVTSQITAQQRRDSGESLVASKLSELRTILNLKDDPEDLVRLHQWSEKDLRELIDQAGADKNALISSAMKLRKQGNDLYLSGALNEALEKQRQSWALLAESYRRDRSNQATFFELGQAEFYIGQTRFDQGELEKAEYAFMSYAEITRRLILLQPENADWVLEMAYALNNLGALQEKLDANNPERHLQLTQSALDYNQIALVLDPTSDYYKSELGQSYAFHADAQIGVCDLEGALQSRQKNVVLEQEILEKDDENIQKIRRLAFAMSGYAIVKEQTGHIDEAIASHQKTLELLVRVLLQNPNDKNTIRDTLMRKSRLAILRGFSDELDVAWDEIELLNEEWRDFFEDGVSDASYGGEDYTNYLHTRASLALSRGYLDLAEQLLKEIMQRVSETLRSTPAKRIAEGRLMRAAFLYWELKQEMAEESVLSLLPDFLNNTGRSRGCADAGFAMTQAIMLGDFQKAHEFADYLLGQGFRHPGFMRVCEQYSLCEGW